MMIAMKNDAGYEECFLKHPCVALTAFGSVFDAGNRFRRYANSMKLCQK